MYECRDGCVLRRRAYVRECGVLEGKDRSGDCRCERPGRVCVCVRVCVLWGDCKRRGYHSARRSDGRPVLSSAPLAQRRRIKPFPEYHLAARSSASEARPMAVPSCIWKKPKKNQKKPKPIFCFSPALTLQWSGNAVPRSKLALISRVCSPNARSIFRLKCSFLSLMCVTSFSS